MKLDFSLPAKCDVLFLDDEILNLNHKKLKFFSLKKDKIYVFILLKTILNYLLLKNNLNIRQSYKKNLYEFISPKIVVSHHINRRGSECKKLCPKIKVLLYQLTYFHRYKPLNGKIDKDMKYDYFLVWSKKDIECLNLKNRKKIFVSGSLRNNIIKLPVIKNKQNKVMLISHFDPNDLGKKGFIPDKINKFYKIIDEYCLSTKTTLMIALRSKRRDKSYKTKDEINYFNSILNCKKKFNLRDKNSYITGSKSELIINYHSNLGFELLSRTFKVLFLPFHETKLPKVNYLEKKDNLHIHRNENKVQIFKKINFLLNYKKRSWDKKIKNKQYLINFEPENKTFNKIISSHFK